jgi:hypothetical protein
MEDRMNRYRVLAILATVLFFIASLLLRPSAWELSRAAQATGLAATAPALTLGLELPASSPQAAADAALPAGTRSDWLAGVQADIQRSEYQITWQPLTPLADLPAAYQAPNRAQGFRTYFAPEGLRVVPRTDAAGWQLSLRLPGAGPVTRPIVEGNQAEYHLDGLDARLTNGEAGLELRFVLSSAAMGVDLAVAGDLTAVALAGGTAVEFGRSDGTVAVRFGNLRAFDAGGHPVAAHLALDGTPDAAASASVELRIVTDASAVYPVVVLGDLTAPATPQTIASSPSATLLGDQSLGGFGSVLGTAGDVNGDGYSDIIVGVPMYDTGLADVGLAFAFYGSPGGVITSAQWVVQGNQAGGRLGAAVGTAGDVNGDGYADVIVGVPFYDTAAMTDAGRVWLILGSADGLAGASWHAEGEQAGARFGAAVSTAGDLNGDGCSDIVVGSPLYSLSGALTETGRVYVFHGITASLPSLTPSWTADFTQTEALFGTKATAAGDVHADGYGDLIVSAPGYDGDQADEGAVFLFAGSSSGLSCGGAPGCVVNASDVAEWHAESHQSNSGFGLSLSTAGDVEADGYASVIVGAPAYSSTKSQEGAAFVWYGYYGLDEGDANWVAVGGQANAHFGVAVGTAGDVNGDGIAEVLIGATDYVTGAYTGTVSLFYGSTNGLKDSATAGSADWTAKSPSVQGQPLEFGGAVASAGDVNGDGFSDVLIGAGKYDAAVVDAGAVFVYQGSPRLPSTAPQWAGYYGSPYNTANFGMSVASAGDVNGDGYADVIVGVPGYDFFGVDAGGVHVYMGDADGVASGASQYFGSLGAAGAKLGFAVGGAGDLNGDGYADIFVTAPWYTGAYVQGGAVYVLYGSANFGISNSGNIETYAGWKVRGTAAQAYLGTSVASAGDVNGDGYADLILGAYNYDGQGKAFVFHGSASGLKASPVLTQANWIATSPVPQAGAYFGRSVASAGDVNGDGFSDVVVGAHGYDVPGLVDAGQICVYHGSPSGLSQAPDRVISGTQASAFLGFPVAGAGDVNGDGYSDIVAGAHGYDNGQTNEGAAFVYHGSAGGIGPSAVWSAEGNQASAYFGYSVATAGDTNADGYSDVIIGAYGYDNGQTDEGMSFLYLGSAGGLTSPAVWTTEGNQTGANLGYQVAGAGDVNGDGFADLIVGAPNYDYTLNVITDTGRAWVYLGNGGDGEEFTPRQLRSGGARLIGYQGKSDSFTGAQLRLYAAAAPMGWEQAGLHWQVAPLGGPFGGAGTLSGTTALRWIQNDLIADVAGLTPGTPYHWRARLVYRAGNILGQSAGPWLAIPWNSWAESDFRTKGTLVFLPVVTRQ